MQLKRTLKKSLFIILSVSMLIISLNTPLFAVAAPETPTVQPRWANVVSINMGLGFDDPTVAVNICIAGQNNATFTDGVVTLKKMSGTDAGKVYTWDNLSSDLPFFTFTDYSVPRTRGTYKLTISIMTHGLNGTELFTKDFSRTY